ncbi:LysR family transcriptional regulator [Variovorax sp. NFACC27]|uniref:LysR family transcriptional regulator n=1 Tax=unclassified Variovorax TaxID=663243 RepID=UPI000895A50D|nr:DNA-binding transcriptional regulator, LysR family [Variovorax sp. NFACC28]SEG45453.1 DNA-binding transcriptional regulator, LysR family [Variovorax sp. NFACC29]SFC27837.1 DNA-binding transcriptional regulator, LysR family [Variovorax sp. NFACC26]SFG61886.1 DNA-binding transcriptional regulator, LysR family [Variovorax sp. NFACC27]
MNLSTRQLRAFLQVARVGNFTRAAEQAHITQAGLSILIREMEKQLGCRLFDRTTRVVSLTPAGRRLLPVVERMVTDLDDVAAELGAEGDAARQTLRIAATPLVSSHLLPQVFASFREAHPQVSLRLFDADLRDVEAMVTAGEADVGLGFFFKAAPGLAREPVGRFHLMRVAPMDEAGEPGAVGSAPWSALRGAELVGLPPGNPIQKVIDQHLAAIGRADAQRTSFNFFGTLISMVEAGFGTAVMPTFALAACRRHRVRTDVLTKPKVGLDFYRITKRGAYETEAMQAFVATLEKALPELSR